MRRAFKYWNFYFHSIWNFRNIIWLLNMHFLHIYKMQKTPTNGLPNQIRYSDQATVSLKNRLNAISKLSHLINGLKLISPFQGYSVILLFIGHKIQSFKFLLRIQCRKTEFSYFGGPEKGRISMSRGEFSPLEMKKSVSVQCSLKIKGNHFQAFLIAEMIFNEAIFEFVSNIFF